MTLSKSIGFFIHFIFPNLCDIPYIRYYQGFEVYAKVLENPVPRTPVTATAAVAVSTISPTSAPAIAPVTASVSASETVSVSVAKDITIVAKTPEKSTQIHTLSPTSITGDGRLLSHQNFNKSFTIKRTCSQTLDSQIPLDSIYSSPLSTLSTL